MNERAILRRSTDEAVQKCEALEQFSKYFDSPEAVSHSTRALTERYPRLDGFSPLRAPWLERWPPWERLPSSIADLRSWRSRMRIGISRLWIYDRSEPRTRLFWQLWNYRYSYLRVSLQNSTGLLCTSGRPSSFGVSESRLRDSPAACAQTCRYSGSTMVMISCLGRIWLPESAKNAYFCADESWSWLLSSARSILEHLMLVDSQSRRNWDADSSLIELGNFGLNI